MQLRRETQEREEQERHMAEERELRARREAEWVSWRGSRTLLLNLVVSVVVGDTAYTVWSRYVVE